MSEVVIRDSTHWRGPGGPRVEINSDLIELLEECYQQDGVLEIPGNPDDEDVKELIRQARIYARRKNLSFSDQVNDDGILLLRLRDKRPYSKKKAAA